MGFKETYTSLLMAETKRNADKVPGLSGGLYPYSRVEHTWKWKAPKSASQMEALVIKFLKLNGHQAQKITTTGLYREDKKTFKDAIGRTRLIGSGKWTPGTATKGAADITSTVYGLKVDWEVKFSRGDKQSDAQKGFEKDVKVAKGLYFVIRSPDDFLDKYMALLEYPQVITMKAFFHENNTD